MLQKFKIPNYVLEIINILNKNNKECFLVGGCVRDLFLNHVPKDYDITTNALPEEIINIFKNENFNVIETGLKHGTVTIGKHNSNEYCEVTTYRIDGEYINNRSPETVFFTSKIEEDLSRRDFTMNAIAYNPITNKIIDPFFGQLDIKNKTIKCVGNPKKRFQEDALRILRAIRFSICLDFKIEQETYLQILLNTNLLTGISWERKRDEFEKIILSGKKNILLPLKETDILHFLVPEIESTYNFKQFNPWHMHNVFEHIAEVMNNVPNDLELKLAAMFHDIGKPYCFTKDENGIGHFYNHPEISKDIAKKCLERLRFDNKTIKNVLTLIKYHDYPLEIKPTDENIDSKRIKRAKKLLQKLDNDEDLALKLILLKIADGKGQNINNPKVLDSIENSKTFINIINLIVSNEEKPENKRLAINGNDLKNIGFSGINIGKEIERLMNVVIDNEEHNNKTYLIELAQKDFLNIIK